MIKGDFELDLSSKMLSIRGGLGGVEQSKPWALVANTAGLLFNAFKASIILCSAQVGLNYLKEKSEYLKERITWLENLPNLLHEKIKEFTGSERVADVALTIAKIAALYIACQASIGIFDLSFGKMIPWAWMGQGETFSLYGKFYPPDLELL